MNNAKLQLEVVSPTTIKCGHVGWIALDTKLVGKVKALIEENKDLKISNIYLSKTCDRYKEVLARIDKAIETLEKRIEENEEIDYVDMTGKSYINYQKEIIDILRGEDEK